MSLSMRYLLALLLCFTAVASAAEKADKVDVLAPLTVQVKSTKDGTDQPVVFYCPPGAERSAAGESIPLLVALHSWSGDLKQATSYLPHARERGWIMVAPNFRGPNTRPEACASDLAVQDVLDAIQYARQHARVDETRIYLTGSSGGGHMSLIMLSRHPDLWAGVSAWVPITDLAAWHAENVKTKRGYDRKLEASCGGKPGDSAAVDAEYRHRSSLWRLPQIRNVPTDISAGIHDGHTGSVPISHTLLAFNALADANGLSDRKLTAEQIAEMTATRKVPASLVSEAAADPERKKAVLFRREAGPVRVTIFEGGHENELPAALDWLARQRKGQPAAHTPTGPVKPRKSPDATEVPK